MIRQQTKKELISASLFDLVEQNIPFHSITVQDITDNCGISRRTFYNCFKDKYDVISQLYEETSMPDILKKSKNFYSYILTSCQKKEKRKLFWKKIFKDQACCEYLELLFYHMQCKYIESTHTLSNYEKALLKFYSLGLFHTETDWILNGCQISSETIATILLNTVPFEIKNIYPAPFFS